MAVEFWFDSYFARLMAVVIPPGDSYPESGGRVQRVKE